MKAVPTTRAGLSAYYAERAEIHARKGNTQQFEEAVHLALWYLLLHMAFSGGAA